MKILRIAAFVSVGLTILFFTDPDNVATIEAFRIVVKDKIDETKASKGRREHEKFMIEDEARRKLEQENAALVHNALEEKMALEKKASLSFSSTKLHGLFEGSVSDLKLLSDGDVLVAGHHRQTLGLAKLNKELNLDANFSEKIFILSRDKVSGPVSQIQVDQKGRIYLLGQFNLKTEKNPFALLRLTKDGELDRVFQETAMNFARPDYSHVIGAPLDVYSNRLNRFTKHGEPHFSLYAGGLYLFHLGLAKPSMQGLTRLDEEGAVDPHFKFNGKQATQAVSIQKTQSLSDGRVLIAATPGSLQPLAHPMRLYDTTGKENLGFRKQLQKHLSPESKIVFWEATEDEIHIFFQRLRKKEIQVHRSQKKKLIEVWEPATFHLLVVNLTGEKLRLINYPTPGCVNDIRIEAVSKKDESYIMVGAFPSGPAAAKSLPEDSTSSTAVEGSSKGRGAMIDSFANYWVDERPMEICQMANAWNLNEKGLDLEFHQNLSSGFWSESNHLEKLTPVHQLLKLADSSYLLGGDFRRVANQPQVSLVRIDSDGTPTIDSGLQQ